ncbi:MAG: acetylglutamate kinase [Acetobacter sp.]|nr:acetylglutamate kinase [Acetobacter sp.]
MKEGIVMTSQNFHIDAAQEAAILAGALPYLRRYAGDTIVIKYGGHAMGDDILSSAFGRDIALLKLVGINPVVVHGGGPQINQMFERLGISSTFIDGLRVTDADMMDVIEMVLSGSVNKEVARLITQAGALAVGVSGKDGHMITACKMKRAHHDHQHDLGYVGTPIKVDPRVIYALSGSGLIPVIAPIGLGEDGTTYNINADTAAGAVAGAVRATRLLMLTDVAGVLDRKGELIPELTASQARQAIEQGIIIGGMIPKVETCIEAVEGGAQAAVIIDGRIPHACLLELFTADGSGTLIRADDEMR